MTLEWRATLRQVTESGTSDKAYDNVEQVWGYKEDDKMGGKDIYSGSKGTEEEQAFIDGPTEELCAMVTDWQIGQAMDLPPEAWAHIKEHGFFALIIPKSFGGKGSRHTPTRKSP